MREWKAHIPNLVYIKYPSPFPSTIGAYVDSILGALRQLVDVHLVGYSFGGLVALEVATRIRVKCLMLLGTTAPPVSNQEADFLRRALSVIHSPRDMQALAEEYPGMSPAIAKLIGQVDSDQLRAAINFMLLRPRAPSQIQKVTIPTVVIVSARYDRVFPAEEHTHRIKVYIDTHVVTSRVNVHMLDSADHFMANTFTGKHGAEFVLRCGSLSLRSKLEIFARNKPLVLAIAIVCIFLTLYLFCCRRSRTSKSKVHRQRSHMHSK
jgi:pimeloyl-ACP methyl ester carboxylesterase